MTFLSGQRAFSAAKLPVAKIADPAQASGFIHSKQTNIKDKKTLKQAQPAPKMAKLRKRPSQDETNFGQSWVGEVGQINSSFEPERGPKLI
jgi:hypothetical protein